MEPSPERDGETASRNVAPSLTRSLQWSRRLNATESGTGESSSGERGGASMEPSPERDGELMAMGLVAGPRLASMEPSPERDGEHIREAGRREPEPGFNGAVA